MHNYEIDINDAYILNTFDQKDIKDWNTIDKYVDLKNKLEVFEKTLEQYKTEVLDRCKLSNKTIYLNESMLKLAFKDLVEAHEELVNIRLYDPNYEYENGVDIYV